MDQLQLSSPMNYKCLNILMSIKLLQMFQVLILDLKKVTVLDQIFLSEVHMMIDLER